MHRRLHACLRCTLVCTHMQDPAGVMRSRHLPARCTPAVNQCLEGAAGAATPRERRAAKGHPRFPQPLMVAAWKESGACQPVSCPLPFPDEEMGLGEEQDLVGATSQGQVGLEFLPSPRSLSWSLPSLPSPRCLPHTHPCPMLPAWKEEAPGGLAHCLQTITGHREAWATPLCERRHSSSESCPVRAGAATNWRGSSPSLGVFKQVSEAARRLWGGLSDHRVLPGKAFPCSKILRASDPLNCEFL